MFPFTRVPFWVPIFDPQPHWLGKSGFANGDRFVSSGLGFMVRGGGRRISLYLESP